MSHQAAKISSQHNTPPPARVEQLQSQQGADSQSPGSPSTSPSSATSPAAAAAGRTQHYTEIHTCPSGFSFEYTPVHQFLGRPREDRPRARYCSYLACTHCSEQARQEPEYVYSDERPYSPPARQGTSAAPTHRAQVQAATEPGSITSVLERYLASSRNLVEQHRTQTRALLLELEQQKAEIQLLQDERQALFHFRPLGKRKREESDRGFPLNFFGERPDISPWLRLPDLQYIQEPKVQDTWRIRDQHGLVVYDSGIAVNIENTLERYVLPRQIHKIRPNLYPLECTSLISVSGDSPSKDYYVESPDGRIRVFGYGLAQATVPYPNGRWGVVAYWAYYAPQAETSYRTRYGLLGSSVRHIDQYGNQHPPDRGTASGLRSSAA